MPLQLWRPDRLDELTDGALAYRLSEYARVASMLEGQDTRSAAELTRLVRTAAREIEEELARRGGRRAGARSRNARRDGPDARPAPSPHEA